MDGRPPPPDPQQPAQPPTPPGSNWGQPLPPPPPPPGRTLGNRPFALQPMGVGEILDAAIKLYRSQWKRLMAIVAIALVPITFLQVFLTRTLGSPFATDVSSADVEGTLITSSVVGLIQLLVVQPFLTAAVAKASADVYLGHAVLVGPTFRFAVSRIHSILWISILLVLVVLLPVVAIGILAVLVDVPELLVFLPILLVIPAIVVFVRFYFGSTVLVVEGKKGSKALRRSWRLAKGSFWKVLGTVLLAAIMAGLIEAILSIPGAVAFGAVGPAGWPLYAIGLSLAAILTTPFTTLIAVLLYFDLRIRKEAFDLEVMAEEMSSPR
jgi:hypothetical protein